MKTELRLWSNYIAFSGVLMDSHTWVSILKGNLSFDLILMHSLLNLFAGDQKQSKFLEHGE